MKSRVHIILQRAQLVLNAVMEAGDGELRTAIQTAQSDECLQYVPPSQDQSSQQQEEHHHQQQQNEPVVACTKGSVSFCVAIGSQTAEEGVMTTEATAPPSAEHSPPGLLIQPCAVPSNDVSTALNATGRRYRQFPARMSEGAGQKTTPFSIPNKRPSSTAPNSQNQQNMIKLEELLSELHQLDMAVNGGTLLNDFANVRALLVHEIHKVQALLPLYLKRRFASQMPSTMKRIVCVPISKRASPFHGSIGQPVGSIPDLESTIGAQVRKWNSTSNNCDSASSAKTTVEEKSQEEPVPSRQQRRTASEKAVIKAKSSDLGATAPNKLQGRPARQRICASIPSLLDGPGACYYAEHSAANCGNYGSACSLMGVTSCAGGGGGNLFLSPRNYMYPYRCDFAQHVRFENDQFTMQERIYLPENPSFKIIGRILGPRGNSLRQLEAETRCRIVIRGKGSVKDMHKEKRLRGLPGWEHLNESLHVLITAQHTDKFVCSRQLHYAVHCIKNLLTPRFDAYKREQLLQLAIINGTYQPRP